MKSFFFPASPEIFRNIVFRLAKRCRLALRCGMCVLLLVAGLFAGLPAEANNVRLPGIVRVTDVTSGVATLEIDVEWDNCWRDNFNWDAVWLFLKMKPDGGAWSHVALQDITHTATGDFTVMNGKSGSNVVGVYVFRSTNYTGPASTTVTLKYKCGSYTKAYFDRNDVFLLAQGVEMVYVPFGAYYLGDGRSNQTLCNAAGQPIALHSEEALALSQRAADGVVTTAVSSLPAAYPKGSNGYYVMKYELSQEQYATFLNTLTQADQESLLTAERLAALTPGDYLFGAANAASNRNGIVLKNKPSGEPCVFANNLNGNAIYGEDGDGLCVACNYLSITDLIAYASWSGLRPMSELEYERACRPPLPQEPLPGEYVWSAVNGLSKASSLSDGGKGSELVSAGSNTNSGGSLSAASRGPVRCGVFATGSSTQVAAGATYWGVMEMGGNVKELVAGVANDRLYRTGNGSGSFSTSAWNVIPSHYGVRGGGFTSPDTLVRTSDRTEAVGYFSDVTTRDSTVGFRLVRTLDAGSVTVNAGTFNPVASLCLGLPVTVTEETPASVTPTSLTPAGPLFLNYVWLVREGYGAFTVIPGELGATLMYTNLKENTPYQFKRKVFCALGEAETLSNSVKPLSPVKITSKPAGLSTCEGGTFTLRVSATGADLTYQWLKDGVILSGETEAIYTNSNPIPADVGNYVCVVSGTCSTEASSPASVIMPAEATRMTDPRDGKVYLTRVMADGREWMIEDLMFGDCRASDFKSYSRTTAKDIIAPNYYGVCMASSQPGAGYLYNWQAAMNHLAARYDNGSNPSGNVSGNNLRKWQGICPPGWHLPSGGYISEFQQLDRALGQKYAKFYPGTTCDGWRGQLGGQGSDGNLSGAGSGGYYWSSTFYNNLSAYYLYLSASSVSAESAFTARPSGKAVRCIKDY